MKTVAAIFCVTCAVVYSGVVVADSLALPEEVAADFGKDGKVDGTMSRSGFVAMMAGIGIGFPLLLNGLTFAARYLPAGFLNVPRALYWRRPENYHRACDMLLVSTLWYGAGFLLTQAGLFHVLASANREQPPVLNTGAMLMVTAAIAVLTLLWIAGLVISFRRAAPATA